MNLFQYAQQAGKMSRAEFEMNHPEPFMLIKPYVSLDDSKIGTMAIPINDESEADTPLGRAATVVVIRKRRGANAFTQMITVGRASNNDIMVPIQEVSKFHAYFSWGPGGQVTITDANSTNGTSVRGSKLEEGGSALLQPADPVGFGSLGAFFHSPGTFYEYLQEVIAHPEKAYFL